MIDQISHQILPKQEIAKEVSFAKSENITEAENPLQRNQKRINRKTMDTIKTRFVEIVSYFFILLFCYASISKIIDFENFQIQIAQSPLLSAFSNIISYGILILELTVSVLLIAQRTRRILDYTVLLL